MMHEDESDCDYECDYDYDYDYESITEKEER